MECFERYRSLRVALSIITLVLLGEAVSLFTLYSSVSLATVIVVLVGISIMLPLAYFIYRTQPWFSMRAEYTLKHTLIMRYT